MSFQPSAFGNGGGGDGLTQEESLQRTLNTAANRLDRILATPGISETQRQEALTSRARVDAAINGTTDPQRLSPVLRGVFSALAVPNQLLGAVAGTVNEVADVFREDEDASISDLFTQITGIDSEDRSPLEQIFITAQAPLPFVLTTRDGIGFESRDISLQGTFTSVTDGLPYGGTALGLVADLALDPLTYLGGAGFFTNTAETGLRAGGSKLIINGVNRRSLATGFVNEADRLLGLGASIDRVEGLREIGQRIGADGINRAQLKFDDELARLFSEYASTGLSFRVPFSGQARSLDIPDLRVFGHRPRIATRVRAVGDIVGGQLIRVTPDGRRFLSSARGGPQRTALQTVREGIAGTPLRGTQTTDFGPVARDRFRANITATGILQDAKIARSEFVNSTSELIRQLVPNVEVTRGGSLTRESRREIRFWDQEGTGRLVRDAIENTPEGRSPTVNLGVERNGDLVVEEFDVSWVRDLLTNVRTMLNNNDVVVGDVDNFFPRILNPELIADDLQAWRSGTPESRKRLFEQRKWARGEFMGIDPKTGEAIVLREGTLAEVEEVMDALGDTYTNTFSDRLITSLDSYLNGLANLVERESLHRDLAANGLLKTDDSASGLSVTRLLENTVDLRAFDDEDVQALLSQFLPRLNRRQQAIEGPNVNIAEVARLQERRRLIRREAVSEINTRESLRQNLRDLNLRRSPANRVVSRTIDNLAEQERLAVNLQEQIFEVDDLISSIPKQATTDSSLRRLRRLREELTGQLEEAEEAVEIARPVAEQMIRSSTADGFGEYLDVSMQLAALRGRDLRSTVGGQVIKDVIADLNEVAGDIRYNNKRQQLIANNRLRKDVVSRISQSNLDGLTDTLKEIAGNQFRGVDGQIKKLKPDQISAVEELVDTTVILSRFQDSSLRSIMNDPYSSLKYFRTRANALLDESQSAPARTPAEVASRDHLLQGSRLADAAVRILEDANAARNELRQLPDPVPGQVDEFADLRRELSIDIKARTVFAQEAGLQAELTRIGQPFSGDRLLRVMENMTESQWQDVARMMQYQSDELTRIAGSSDLALTPEIAEIVVARSQFSVEAAGRWTSATRSARRFFSAQALASPSFSPRNMISAAHMNYVVSGLWRQADYKRARDLLVAARQEQSGVNPDALTQLVARADNGYGTRDAEIARAMYSRIDRNQTRVADGLDRLTGNAARGEVTQSEIRDTYFTTLGELTTRNDRGTARVLSGGGLRRGAEAEDFGVEEYMRFAQGVHSMTNNNMTLDQAYSLVVKTHFDYSDLSARDVKIRDTMFPFWTFMSRNLPLQVEMLAKRPGAYNNLVAWQEINERRAETEGVSPSYFTDELHYTVPEDVWLFFGDRNVPVLTDLLSGSALTPDLAFNDLLRRSNDLSDILDAENGTGLANVGGVDLTAVANLVLGESSPWTRIMTEFAFERDAFSGRRLTDFETPIVDDVVPGGVLSEVLYPLFLPLGWARKDPIDPARPEERRILFDSQINQVLRNFNPMLSRAANILDFNNEGLDQDEIDRNNRRAVAATISFIFGGVRVNNASDESIAALELSNEAEELLRELQNFAVPDAG